MLTLQEKGVMGVLMIFRPWLTIHAGTHLHTSELYRCQQLLVVKEQQSAGSLDRSD